MRAVRIHAKQDMRTEEVPSLDPAADEVRLRVGYVGICGSDLHYYQDGVAGIFAIRAPFCAPSFTSRSTHDCGNQWACRSIIGIPLPLAERDN